MSSSIIDVAVAILTHPLDLVRDAGARTYGPWLALALAAGLAAGVVRARSLPRAARALLSPRIWWHRSARMDYRLIVANGAIRTVLLAPLALSALAVAMGTIELLVRVLGAPAPSSLSPGAIVALYTVVLFVAWDFSRYLVHRLLHAVPVLWQLHQVHHSAEVLTPFTVHRVHPLESLLFQLRGAITTGVVTGAFFYAFQDRAVQYELLGVNALGMAFNAVAANLRHSHVWLSFGPVIERLFISPAQHQLHHSVAPDDHGHNYGSCLAIWDWLGGSLRLAGPRRQLRFGLPAAERNHHPARVASAIAGPLAAIAGRLPAPRLGRPRKDPHEATVA